MPNRPDPPTSPHHLTAAKSSAQLQQTLGPVMLAPGRRLTVGERRTAQRRRVDELDELVRTHGGVITAPQAHAAGLSKAALEWAVRKQRLVSLRRAVYTSNTRWQTGSPEQRHVLRILAAQRLHPEMVATAVSAAVVLGLPIPGRVPERPHLTVARNEQRLGARGYRANSLVRRSWLSDDEIQTLRNGVRVTSPVRTVLDCSREWDEPWGLAIADAALARSLIDPVELLAAAKGRPIAPSTRRSIWAAEHVRPKVESPLESLGRGVIVLAGLPEPEPQVWLTTSYGRIRADLMDVENRVITEADGKVKYFTPETAWDKKRREDAIRDAGFEVVRFTIDDYRRRKPWLHSYRRALVRGARRSD